MELLQKLWAFGKEEALLTRLLSRDPMIQKVALRGCHAAMTKLWLRHSRHSFWRCKQIRLLDIEGNNKVSFRAEKRERVVGVVMQ